MLVLMFYCTLFRHIPSGPNSKLAMDSTDITQCHKYWWTNLLYIQNFYPFAKETDNAMVRNKVIQKCL